jgi:hypothetical protein
MKVKKLKEAYQCLICEEWYDSEEEAVYCCEYDKVKFGDAYKCGECDTVYEDRKYAKECCR